MPIKTPVDALKLLDMYGPDRIVIALDHKNGYIMVNGWQESTDYYLCEALDDFTRQGYQLFLVTNIDLDGTLRGPDITTYTKISTRANIIASGGVCSLEDIRLLKETGIQAVVIGKALYENSFTLAEARDASLC
jgi:phosphoribosylformimino-5-aminoimidazole carboxamide ribotide isomerase